MPYAVTSFLFFFLSPRHLHRLRSDSDCLVQSWHCKPGPQVFTLLEQLTNVNPFEDEGQAHFDIAGVSRWHRLKISVSLPECTCSFKHPLYPAVDSGFCIKQDRVVCCGKSSHFSRYWDLWVYKLCTDRTKINLTPSAFKRVNNVADYIAVARFI